MVLEVVNFSMYKIKKKKKKNVNNSCKKPVVEIVMVIALLNNQPHDLSFYIAEIYLDSQHATDSDNFSYVRMALTVSWVWFNN